ncbi:MAG: hemerythrin family protein [Candidatus Contendobacter sp.]|nr:hemerythrin family protein [Candidatus Contendobacter sp.]MDG4557354.1 hemerythrin family protein [Candidatus Contendobacter sp.]
MNPSLDPHGDELTAIVDAEHHVQVSLAQALRDTVQAGKDAALTGKILEQLTAYSDVHFMSEQLLMRMSGYPDYEDHVLDHERMMERLEEARNRHDTETEPVTLAEAESLLALLARHIGAQDRAFADYYRAWARRGAEPIWRSSIQPEHCL